MITVLMAVYQGRRYLEQQLDSILAQTVPVRIRISDDGSQDGTRELLQAYKKWYPDQIILDDRDPLKKTGNQRIPAPARNFFWLMERERAEGKSDYVMLSDQDDVWHNDKVRRQLARIRRLESETDAGCPILVHSDMEVIDGDGALIHPSFFRYQNCRPQRLSLAEVLVENPVTGAAVMMNRALLKLAGRTPSACCMHDWWLALTASAFGMTDWIQEPLSQYRQHEANQVGARRAGGLSQLSARLGRGREIAWNYRRMMEQAAAFGREYAGLLEPEQRAVIHGFLALPGQTPLQRLVAIGHYNFRKSSPLQTAAMCVTIPRGKSKGGRA